MVLAQACFIWQCVISLLKSTVTSKPASLLMVRSLFLLKVTSVTSWDQDKACMWERWSVLGCNVRHKHYISNLRILLGGWNCSCRACGQYVWGSGFHFQNEATITAKNLKRFKNPYFIHCLHISVFQWTEIESSSPWNLIHFPSQPFQNIFRLGGGLDKNRNN